MRRTFNGMAASDLADVVWQKSRHSNSQGTCVEFARLPDGEVAVRNSRFPEGPALIYTRAEIEAMLLGVKDGEFDHLVEP
ncbi:regulator [Streptantibioticus cattleyicolor NRRL 8057 = DSM 46488]|uniref:Regulator n=1 Tax=Streptantibioticus cattleyicolor (strain ATCC 35852 / DSM 46488 / JCM 4925 / NBRC 14057 / NRRL 8057) TaxID=1003195 RepID=F8JPK8_STREN|nr:regulator [Streptantibioticus cattleyicolor NRRL 8057 = DSM 46488]CCB78095.1 Regulatory protein [Streptantibioticus cattleyicolor NRRL 8057 = DSM 46488]